MYSLYLTIEDIGTVEVTSESTSTLTEVILKIKTQINASLPTGTLDILKST